MRRGYARLLLLELLLALLLTGCGQGSHTPFGSHGSNPTTTLSGVPSGPWLAQLASYPQGQVSARAPLTIQFTHPVVDDSQLNKPAKKLIRLDPDFPVTTTFTATNTLQITPAKPFPQGQTFTLTLYPQGLEGVDSGLAPWVTELAVMRQSFTVRVDSLAPSSDGQMMLAGQLQTADMADPAAVEQVLSATQNGKSLKVNWQHDAAGLIHSFTVLGVQRTAQASPVSLLWNGNPIGVDDRGGRDYPVPLSADAFEVTLVRTLNDPKPHVRVEFSQALQVSQNLAGLVTLDGKPVTTRINGNALDIYPSDKVKSGKVTLVLNAGIRSDKDVRFTGALTRTLVLEVLKPAVRFVGQGSILPNGKILSVPFEAVGAKAVKVQAFEVFENNIPYYLQSHALDSANVDTTTGRWLWQKTISLPPDNGDGWQRYQLDLTELMAKHPHGLILLTLNLDADTSNWQCTGKKPTKRITLPPNDEGSGQGDDMDSYYQDAGYVNWNDRDDPCSDAYYTYNTNVTATHAFIASNLGLIAKQGQNDQLLVFASWLDHNTPADGVAVRAYDYQNQLVGSGKTDGKGDATLTLSGTAFYLVADKGDQKGYLKLARNLALPTNQFDTGGVQVRGGLKGVFYGERDVWRPGDAIHLTFVLSDPDHRLPANYPVTLDWFNPRGEKVASFTNSKPVGNFYVFNLSTDEQAPTGNWRAVARIGKRSFDTRVRVEAIKPNHLKIDIDTPARLTTAADNPVTLHSQWLNGAIAANLKADVKVRLLDRTASFAGYDGFDFNDPTRKLAAEPFTAFDGQLDATGKVTFALSLPDIEPAGMATAVLTTRVFENSGDYSTQIRSFPVMPYAHWVGIRVPKGTGWGDAIARDRDTEIGLLTLDSAGKPEAHRRLTLSVYRVDWRWWWDSDSKDDLANFVNGPDTHRLKQVKLVSDAGGRAQWKLHGPDYDWGRYLIRVCQDTGKQCAAQTVYLGWGGERGAGGDAATRLALSTDKAQYKVGDTAHVQVPVAGGGRLLVSIESGDKVLRDWWVDVPKGKATQMLDIPVTAAMAPNVYVDVTLLQPHAERDNDRPIRLYGITPLLVTDPTTHLVPVIEVPAQVRPESDLPVRVREQQGRPMTYTLAVVDEGLLGLTNFQTPSLHNDFYQREALGVLTWDIYDQVVGAYGGNLDRLLAVGGSDMAEKGREKQSRRFPPVVRFLGPFQLKKGETQLHDVKLPAYMGQVRVMVVAGDGRAYGSADKDVLVTQPLTLLATLPRVLGPGERLDLPVTVFAAADRQGKVPQVVTLSADAQAPLTLTRSQTTLRFTQAGNQIALLGLQVGHGVGMADVNVRADGDGFTTRTTVHMPVRAANPATTEQQGRVLKKGESWQVRLTPHGVTGTNQSWLSVSRLPDMGLEKRLDYLINYPYGCIEQTTSAVFPQLYLGRLVSLSDSDKQRIQTNIDAAIQRYRRFQLPGGGFSYWPDGGQPSDWGTSYAGHFLLEARRAGYAVPSDLLDSWTAYQKRMAQDLGSHPWDWSTQAYRLYTLALAGVPEVGAMNRLRELLLSEASRQRQQPEANYLSARWLLAAAYQQMGLNDVAGELIPGQVSADYNTSWYYTFGSPLRDDAIALQVRAAAGDSTGAWSLAREIADQLASNDWYSTQSVAWALMSMAKLAGADGTDKHFTFRWRDGVGHWQTIDNTAAIYRVALPNADQVHELEVTNSSEQHLFVAIANRGVPAPGKEVASAKGLALQVRFADLKGNPVDPAHLRQGTDFQAIVTVRNTSGRWLPHVALTQILPSGWQITESPREGDSQAATYNYRDLRDDRVLTYFDLGYNDTRTYRVTLNASFAGHFYLPSWQAEAMYKGDVLARSAGEWVDVVR